MARTSLGKLFHINLSCDHSNSACLLLKQSIGSELRLLSSKYLSFLSLLLAAFAHTISYADEYLNPHIEWGKLMQNVSEASDISSRGLNKFLAQNCMAIIDPEVRRFSEACRVIHLNRVKSELQDKIKEAINRRRLFAIGPLSDYSIRTGFYVLNPRLTEFEKKELVNALTILLVVNELQSHAIEKARLRILLWSPEHDQVTNAVLGSIAVKTKSTIDYFKFWAVRDFWPELKNDLDIIAQRHGEHFAKLAEHLKNYDSIPWAEYEVFLPIIKLDQNLQNIIQSDQDALYTAIFENRLPDGLSEYVVSMTDIVSIPPGLSDDELRLLYTGIFLIFDFEALLKRAPKTLESEGYRKFAYEYSQSIEIQLLSLLNIVTKELRSKENALGL